MSLMGLKSRIQAQNVGIDQLFEAMGIDRQAMELSRNIGEHPKFREMLQSLNPQGHRLWKLTEEMEKGIYPTIYEAKTEELSMLLDSLRAGTSMTEFINLGHSMSMECSECGEYVLLETDGVSMRVHQSCQCPPEGPIEFELNVPSGELVYADDLRPLFNIIGHYNINCRFGLIKQSLTMAKIGCAHGFVGNSCPGVYRVNDTTLAVASVLTDDDTDEPINLPGELVGSICTDLWWYSFADAEEYERRGGTKEDGVDHLKVRPGVYKFSHNLPNGRDDDETFIYATITWVREPDPVKDYLKEFREANFTAGQVIAHQIVKWPTLYRGENAIMAAANHIFCVIGGGGSWHPNGFVQYDPDMPKDTPDMEIPKFDKPYSWYPLSEYSAIVVAAGLSRERDQVNLNPSFAALARNILECMIKHGTISSSTQGNKDPNLDLAKECLRKINELYPENSAQ